jgi:hypothetical protein
LTVISTCWKSAPERGGSDGLGAEEEPSNRAINAAAPVTTTTSTPFTGLPARVVVPG